jgi:hypothetical protein
MKYRKRPVEIEAIKWTGENEITDHPKWFRWAVNAQNITFGDFDPETNLTSAFIATLEGKMEAKPGDFIIQGIKGEIYPCKPDIFEATYEKV